MHVSRKSDYRSQLITGNITKDLDLRSWNRFNGTESNYSIMKPPFTTLYSQSIIFSYIQRKLSLTLSLSLSLCLNFLTITSKLHCSYVQRDIHTDCFSIKVVSRCVLFHLSSFFFCFFGCVYSRYKTAVTSLRSIDFLTYD